MSRIIVYKQVQNAHRGGRGFGGTEPMLERTPYVCEFEAGFRAGSKLFGETLEKLARAVSLNVNGGCIDIRNGRASMMRDYSGNPVETEALDQEELIKFQESLRSALKDRRPPAQ